MIISDIRIIELDVVDSTNNYAMNCIDGNKACNGLTIVARTQTAGKGQRGRNWADVPGASLLMTTIVEPIRPIDHQFAANCGIAVTVLLAVKQLCPNADVFVKWPNDIIVNDKKAGGLLVENVIKGSKWAYAVIGLGLNLNQPSFPESLPFATSLFQASNINFNITDVAAQIASSLTDFFATATSDTDTLGVYNQHLYRTGQHQVFSTPGGDTVSGTISRVLVDGTLEIVMDDGTTRNFRHGEIIWNYGYIAPAK